MKKAVGEYTIRARRKTEEQLVEESQRRRKDQKLAGLRVGPECNCKSEPLAVANPGNEVLDESDFVAYAAVELEKLAANLEQLASDSKEDENDSDPTLIACRSEVLRLIQPALERQHKTAREKDRLTTSPPPQLLSSR